MNELELYRQQVLNDLRLIANDLNQLVRDEQATLHYDLMSDALIWSDERLSHRRVRELWCMRPIFRYRTGLILGMELLQFQYDWEAEKNFFHTGLVFNRIACQEIPN